MKVQDRKAQINFRINALNAQIRLFERFQSNDRKTARKLESLKDERAALQTQLDNEVTWPPSDKEIPF